MRANRYGLKIGAAPFVKKMLMGGRTWFNSLSRVHDP